MERRNFLGLSALMGLAPVLSKIPPVLSKIPIEEPVSPGITDVQMGVVDSEIPEECKILVRPGQVMLTIETGKSKMIIEGEGEIFHRSVIFRVETKGDFICPAVKIDGKHYGEVVSIYEESSKIQEFLIEETDYPIVTYREPANIYIVCRKA